MTIGQILKKLQPAFERKIDNALNSEVLKVVQDTQSDAAAKVVYSMPTSGYYKRRGDGVNYGYGEGIGDPVNIVAEGGSAKGGKLVVVNVTEPNPYLNGVNGARASVNKSLVYVVEYGSGQPGDPGYDYWKNPKARPFISETRKELKRTGAHIDALRRGLKRQGVKTK